MEKATRRRLLALPLALCMVLSSVAPVYAAEAVPTAQPTEVTEVTDDHEEIATNENAVSDDVLEDVPSNEATLSEAAQAFVDAVNALDRESILAVISDWAVAQQAWLADKENADLTAALDAATIASDEAAAPVYAAEDLYTGLTDEDRESDAVQTAYTALAALILTMQQTMQTPVTPGGNGDEPGLDEITAVLYNGLPDAPTGYYIGDYGLPIATGDTKISISAWNHDLLDESNQGRLDANPLNESNATMAVAKQDGADYAIVPIAVQVEYPANGATSTVSLPENVDLLSYSSTTDELIVASDEERAQMLNEEYKETSATASGFYVKASEDFTAQMTYTAPDGTSMSKTLTVRIDDSADVITLPKADGVSTYANEPAPPFTTGKITKIDYQGGTWLVWFNGVEAYCCDHGLNGQPNGCPTYSFAYTSKISEDQYVGTHYGNQIAIWGGLNQLSLGVLTEKHSVDDFATSTFASRAATTYSATDAAVLKTAYQYYDDTQLWIIEHYPASTAAQAHVTWEKRDALTGGRITEDAEYAIYEWSVTANKYQISQNYRVTRLENGLYTVTVTNPIYTDWAEGYVYYTQDNLGKFRIEELTSPAGYTDAALQDGNWVEHWSQEFEITESDQTVSYTGGDADYNRPQGNKVIIKKIEAHTGEIIEDDAVFTLYQWNQERGLYEVSKDYAFVRDAEGLYTITSLHDDWAQYEEGNLYYEDTLCDVREDTVNSDGITTEHPQYYTDYEPVAFPIEDRAVTNDGQFVVVESRSPYGYYGDWTGSRETPNFEIEDAGKHAYYIRLTDDGSTITLTDSEYNAHVLTENKGGTLIELGNGNVVTLDVFRPALEEYDENNLFRNNPWYSTVVWEKRDALTGGLVDADTEFEIQEWNPEKGQYEKSTHYQVVRRDDGKYTVHLIGDAFFSGWEGKQGVLYYHQSNEGKYRLVELRAPAFYNLKAWEHNNWVIGWSEEIVVHPDHPSYEFLGDTASYNMPYKTKVLIKKVDKDTGELIQADTTWTLYEWNERNNQYEVSPNYEIIRRDDGYYTVTTLHSDWEHYEEGYLYFEDTQQDYPESYHRYSDRRFSNQGKFLIVETSAAAGYYGDYWRNDEPGTYSTENGSDLGKRGYAFTLTEDNGTLWLTNWDYNAKILYDVDEGNATLVLADGRPTSVIIDEDKQPEYDRQETAFTNKAKYGYVEFDRSQYRKEWAQTGDDNTYIETVELTSETPEAPTVETAEVENSIRQNGTRYILDAVTAELISGPISTEVTLPDISTLDDVPTTLPYTLEDGSTVTLQLESASWVEQPKTSYTGWVDLGYSATRPQASETETITADDGYTFTGHLVGVEQSDDYQWVERQLDATYYGWPDVKGIFLGNLVLPHNDNAPVYQGYETDILLYLGYDPNTSRITGAEWTGSWQAQTGRDMMTRPAVFTVSVYAASWLATYEEDGDPRPGTASAVYSLFDEQSQRDGLYHWHATATYRSVPGWTVLQTAAAVVGVALLIAALVALLFILSRKKEANKRKEVH